MENSKPMMNDLVAIIRLNYQSFLNFDRFTKKLNEVADVWMKVCKLFCKEISSDNNELFNQFKSCCTFQFNLTESKNRSIYSKKTCQHSIP